MNTAHARQTLVPALLAAFLLTGLTGCEETPVDPGPTTVKPPTETGKEIPPPDPTGPDERVCTADITLAGNFTLETPQPIDSTGCWPIGVWKFAPTVTNNGCAQAPALRASYSFRVSLDEEGNTQYAWLDDPMNTRVIMKVTSGGNALCRGGFELFDETGKKVLNLHPDLSKDNLISGSAEYSVYGGDQWPGD